jgi:ATP-dependent protease ClpP protease subunit
MGAEEAVEYGLIDAVILRPQLIAASNGVTP